MHRAFNLRLPTSPFEDDHERAGEAALQELRAAVADRLRSCFRPDGSLDGTALRARWFPEVACDVFVSHAHRDRETALGLAGWLKDRFGLNAFVDSAIWGDIRRLLRNLDRSYCWDRERGVYDYDRRNRTTAHVHMLLSTALAAMIDEAECLVFLNADGAGVGRVTMTDSPWIFYEIETASRIQTRAPARLLRKGEKIAGIDESRDLKIMYELPLARFAPLDLDALIAWQDAPSGGGHALDRLYALADKGQALARRRS